VLPRCPKPSPVFTGREDVLDQMRTYFFELKREMHVFVLYGLGGTGKSDLAFYFLYENFYLLDAADRRYVKQNWY
jgi:hypothetical protein